MHKGIKIPAKNNGKSDAVQIILNAANSQEEIISSQSPAKSLEGSTTPHSKILQILLNQIEPVDFLSQAFPEIEKAREELKNLDPEAERAKELIYFIQQHNLKSKHFIILSIENVLKVAEYHQWGLCKSDDFIYVYNGSFWSESDKEVFQKFLGEAAEMMGVARFSARFYQFREQLFKQFLGTAYLPKPERAKDFILINLQNGTLEVGLNGARLRAFDNSDFLTYQLPFKYDPDAKAPIFEAYLNRVLPDKERQIVLAEYLGFVFIQHGSKFLKEEKALVLYGGGSNGKSVFYEVVSALLGSENTSSYSLSELTNDNGYYRAMIANKLVNYASEISGKLEADIFKRMVSGEVIPARLPYGTPMQLRQYAKLIFNCNELPKDVEHSHAFFRRFLIIPFDEIITEAEQDKRLHTKIIEAELAGVLNWGLQGLRRLLSQSRFSECKAAERSLEMYKSESNSVKLFLDESGYQVSPTERHLIKDLYTEYRAFCFDDGMVAFKKTNFIKQLRVLGIPSDRNMYGNVAYVGKPT